MKSFRNWIASYTIAPIGWIALMVVAVAFLISGLSPRSAQPPAFILGVAVLLLLAGGLSGGRRGLSTKSI